MKISLVIGLILEEMVLSNPHCYETKLYQISPAYCYSPQGS